MLKRFQARRGDEGFTLIELLVVVIIIGILAAIAIPVFLSQRKKAVDASMKSDLRNVATVIETYATDHDGSYPATADVASAGNVLTVTVAGGTDLTQQITNNNTIAYTLVGSNFCMVADRAAGAQPASQTWVYKSDAGGVQPASVTTC